jgi:hypothetical protein
MERIELLWTSTNTLQTKPKQKFISSFLAMLPTHASEKNKTLFEHSQTPLQIKLKQKFVSSVLSM